MIIAICLLVFAPITLQAQNEFTETEFRSLTLERTEVITLHSDIVEQDFELWISVPKSYTASDTGIYPVIYLLDPYRAFSIVKGYADVITYPIKYIPEVIIVGIGYGGKDPETMLNWALGRTRDMTPVTDAATEELYRNRFEALGVHNVEVHTGGAPKFLNFIEKELFPYIEFNYRTDIQTRMLSGYSLGGLFGMYVLFHKPDLFSKYFIGSPSIHFHDNITFEYELSFSRKHSDLNAEVFLSAGALEVRTSGNIREMEKRLNSRKYENLTLITYVFEKENHVSCYPAAISRALIELFKN